MMLRPTILLMPLLLVGCSHRPNDTANGTPVSTSSSVPETAPDQALGGADLSAEDEPMTAANQQEVEAIAQSAKASANAPVQGAPDVPPEVRASWPGTWIDELQGIVGSSGGYRGAFVGGNTMTGAEVARLSETAKAHPQKIWKIDLQKAIKLTDADLAPLAVLDRLRLLTLPANVTDAGLVHLRGMKGLENATIFSPQVTDAGLQNLEGLKNLRVLVLPDSNAITAEGVRRLKKALPRTQIVSPLDE